MMSFTVSFSGLLLLLSHACASCSIQCLSVCSIIPCLINALHAVAGVLGALLTALREILRKAPTEALLFDNYARLCLIVDELLFEV